MRELIERLGKVELNESRPDFKKAASVLLKKNTGKSQDDFYYSVYLRAVINGFPAEHLVKKFKGADKAKHDLIDMAGKAKYEGIELGEAKMLTKADMAKLPAMYSQEKVKDPIVWVKFFNPYGGGTWLATEYDGKDTFFGYVMGLGGDELGYFSLREMKSNKIERERHWKPMELSKAKAYEKRISGRS